MYIKTDSDGLQAIKTPEMDELAEFSENNIAQVTEDDGNALLDKYPEKFEEHTTEKNGT